MMTWAQGWVLVGVVIALILIIAGSLALGFIYGYREGICDAEDSYRASAKRKAAAHVPRKGVGARHDVLYPEKLPRARARS